MSMPGDATSLYSLLHKAKPLWSGQDLDLRRVHEKLGKIDVRDAESLGLAVSEGRLNAALASAGERRLKSSTVAQLRVAVRDIHKAKQAEQESASTQDALAGATAASAACARRRRGRRGRSVAQWRRSRACPRAPHPRGRPCAGPRARASPRGRRRATASEGRRGGGRPPSAARRCPRSDAAGCPCRPASAQRASAGPRRRRCRR
ncbi:unnamed protein product [Prorocentrum cordatum]|uniref:Uncharacterized protein n=1 Tax=Prorocentrum cordatum TaxID=2364126 RepID=A0ABN9PKZ0_9DINO|nr:unnamed protein product [Polarella glacialis]